MNNHALQEMIRVAIQGISKAKSGKNVTKKEILKVLYLADKDIEDSNVHKKHLAFYWYKDGPMSELIYESLGDMVSAGIVRRHKTDTYETYSLNPEKATRPLIVHDGNMDKIRKIIRNITGNFTGINDTLKKVYDDAPYAWYNTYKPFVNKFTSDTYDKSTINLDELVDTYPQDGAPALHKQAFMGFLGIVRTIDDNPTNLKDLCYKIWNVFSEWVRIGKHHPYYEYKVSTWEQKLEDAIESLQKQFNDIIYDIDFNALCGLVRGLDMNIVADRLEYLNKELGTDPEEDSIELASVRHFVSFLMAENPPVPALGVINGLIQACWWPESGALSADFNRDGTIYYTAINESETITRTQSPESMMCVVKSMRILC